MNKQEIKKLHRDEVTQIIFDFFKGRGEDCQLIASNSIAFPFVSKSGDDEWMKITISIPLGTKDDAFDGYTLAEEHHTKEVERIKKRDEAEAKKAKKIARDKEKRAIAEKGGKD